MSGQTLSNPLADTTSTQWRVIGLCMLFNVIDGMDAMAMAFTVHQVAAQWALGDAQVGLLLSASLVGMACGSLGAAALADRHGRRPLLLLGLSVSGLGMLLSFASQGFTALLMLRAMTGLGVGAVLVGANVLTYEYASAKRRNLAIALQSAAFALGATLGGLLARALNEGPGWRHVFLAGGGITLLAALAGLRWLHESRAYAEAPSGFTQRSLRDKYRELFAPAQGLQTVSLAATVFLLMFSYYFVTSWTPTLLGRDGMGAGMLLNAGGMFGAVLVGVATQRLGSRRLLLGLLVLTATLMTLMMPAGQRLAPALAAGFGTGLLLNGAIAAVYTLAPRTFATQIRASGVGLVLAVGRLGGILSPSVAGLLLEAHWQPQQLLNLYAGSLLLAALLIWRSLPARRDT
ncbi:MFS transporter [Pseudomonas sp. NPDC089401]|uniref:MFS transporter n=1 Tax=Pseudomonas sp. NPDC089401 TaxID=3364462 RepID=UPI003803A850